MSKNIDQNQLIDLSLIVDFDSWQHRANTAPTVKTNTLYKAELLPEKRRDHSDLQHAGFSIKLRSTLNPARELFSGWNCVPQTWPFPTTAVTGTS